MDYLTLTKKDMDYLTLTKLTGEIGNMFMGVGRNIHKKRM